MDWETIARAYELVKSGAVNRIDGGVDPNPWSVYRAGSVIRVDIKGH